MNKNNDIVKNIPTSYMENPNGVWERKVNYDSNYFDDKNPTDDKIDEAEIKFDKDYKENVADLFM